MRVGDIRLLTNGVVFESLPETVVLPPTGGTEGNNTAQLVTLHGTPREHGALELIGYSTHTVGVKSDCYLKSMLGRAFPANYQINVIPALPQLSAATSLPPTATFSGMSTADSVITSAGLTLFNGESAECTIRLTNNSPIPIEYLDESLQSAGLDRTQQATIFQWSHDELQSKLPILPNGGFIEFSVKIYADADFLGPLAANSLLGNNGYDGGGGGPASLTGAMSTLSVSGHASLPSRVSSPVQTPLRRNEMQSSSFRSAQSGHSSLATISLGPAVMNGGPAAAGGAGGGAGNSSSVVRNFEMQLRLRYSGGAGLSEGYCRQCAIAFNLEFLPSAQVTNWDVLPAEM